jgi:hypothetical protein
MRMISALVLLLIAHGASALGGSYHIVVDEEGRAAVFVGLWGSGTVDVPLPVDVSSPTVFNALYVDSPDGIEVSLRGNESATVVYQTSTIATRTPYGWVLDLGFGNNSYSALVSIPNRATVKLTKPDAKVSEDGESINVRWDSTAHVRLLYDYIPSPVKEETTTSSTLPKADKTGTLTPLVLVLAAIVALVAALCRVSRRGKT